MIVGIDLGTTNSLVAVWRDGAAQLIPNALGHVLTPSCVSIAEDDSVLVGLPARERLLTFPDRTAAAFKRYMGSTRRVKLAGHEFRPEELSALVLKSLKADAEAHLGKPVTEAVITVPAYFNDTQRKATRTAGELAGLKVERLLNEPTAAALAYGLHQAQQETQFLIFDLGGGTFDVSILELFDGVMEVRAAAGDNYLGGEDFVSVLVDAFLGDTGRRAGIDPRALRPEQIAQLRNEGERVKRALSNQDRATFKFFDGVRELTWDLRAETFERLSAALIERLRTPIERALRDARLRASDLDRIVLVGGATRMPIVHRLVARLFSRFPNRDVHPDEAVALGAAVQAGLKARDAALDEVVLTDVCPYTLGIETSEETSPGQYRSGLFLPVIERNTVIPASRARVVHALRDYQSIVELKVFQGESREVKDNVPLGSLRVPLPRLPREQQNVEVRFTYDVNGLLEVEACVVATQTRQRLIIEHTPGAMTREEIDRCFAALALLKIHPREQTENRALVERLARLYEQYLGERREWLGRQLSLFEAIVDRQDPNDIAHARSELTRILDQLEGQPWL